MTNSRYANIQPKIYGAAAAVAVKRPSPATRTSPGNRFGLDYRGNKTGSNAPINRSNSRDRVPKINNYTRDASKDSNGPSVHDRLYGKSSGAQA